MPFSVSAMNEDDRSKQASAILAAIRAKRDKRGGNVKDIDALEASLVEDIENFDLDARERQARYDALHAGDGMRDPKLVYPSISPGGSARRPAPRDTSLAEATPPLPVVEETPFLEQLRRQAEAKQRAKHIAEGELAVQSEAIDKALRQVFFYLHELTQQLDIIKPEIQRRYELGDGLEFSGLVWQQGFADYRTQPQSAGALLELVTLSYQLQGSGKLRVQRDGLAAERFRAQLFDFGVQFDCHEIRNERGQLARGEFTIARELAVNLRWRADYRQGLVMLEAHNFERLGSAVFPLAPNCIDEALLDAFGRVILGEPSRFRELARRS